MQGCQIVIGAKYQKWGKITKWPLNIPNGHKTYHMVVKYSKRPQNMPTLSIPRPSKIHPNRDFFVWKNTIWQPWLDAQRQWFISRESDEFQCMRCKIGSLEKNFIFIFLNEGGVAF
jgi:hypothetical protein